MARISHLSHKPPSTLVNDQTVSYQYPLAHKPLLVYREHIDTSSCSCPVVSIAQRYIASVAGAQCRYQPQKHDIAESGTNANATRPNLGIHNSRVSHLVLLMNTTSDPRTIKNTTPHHLESVTGVGAIRLFFVGPLVESWSFSLSLASRFEPTPLAAPLPALGVSGGVVMGIPVTLPELVAAMLGTLPPRSGGLFITDIWVAIDDVELDRAGEDGLALTNGVEAFGGGEGAANELVELRCWWLGGNGEGGAITEVGVGTGVAWFDEVPAPAEEGFLIGSV